MLLEKNNLKRLSIILMGIAVSLFLLINRHRIYRWLNPDSRTINKSEVKIIFREAPDAKTLAKTLSEKGVVKSSKDAYDYIEENYSGYKFAAGKYIVLAQTQMESLIHGFVDSGNGMGNSEVMVNVVFNNCVDIYDVGNHISKCILADSASIVDYVTNPEFLKEHKLSVEEIPSLFLPKAYKMEFDTDAEEFIRFMMKKREEFWTEARLNKMKSIGLKSEAEVATLGSLVYMEQSKLSDEWGIISKLYLNRLDKGMLLQSDPTFRFCWGDELEGIEQLLDVHKNVDCEYNTYKHKGLPPGPIFIVSEDVLDSVLNPSNDDYLFMMAKPGGVGHNFAVTNREHHKNVIEYRKWLKEYLKNKRDE